MIQKMSLMFLLGTQYFIILYNCVDIRIKIVVDFYVKN